MASDNILPAPALDRNGLRRLVDAFYGDLRSDELLGPVFGAALGDSDWEPHLARMTEFWSTVMLGTRSFKGNVYQKHVALAEHSDVKPAHFLRWITLWHRHTEAMYPGDIARELQSTAEGIGRNLFFGFFQQFARFIIEDGVAVDYVAI